MLIMCMRARLMAGRCPHVVRIITSLRTRFASNVTSPSILLHATRSWHSVNATQPYLAKTLYSTQTQTSQTRLTRQDYTVGWVCALPIELAAAQEMLDEEHQGLSQDANDSNIYTLGRMGDHNVVIACLPAGQIGNNSAASVAVQMKLTFNAIRFGLMVGIGGGVPSAEHDVRLGDVVVSQPFKEHGGVVQYDFGKTKPGRFVRTGFLNAPPTILLNAIASLRAKHIRRRASLLDHLSKLSSLPGFTRNARGSDILFEATYKHVGGAQCEQCNKDRVVERPPRDIQEVVIHYGTIASGNQVMRDAAVRDRLSLELGSVLCFEMEAAGLMNSFPCLVIRGICDYADSHKGKSWQAYAAGTAAACAKEVLSVIPMADVAKMRTADEITRETNTSRQAFWSVPFQKNPRFTGRSSEISQVNAMLSSETLCERVAIFGLGGVGKTQIALEFVHQLRERQPDCSIFWIPATSVERMMEAYLEIGHQLRLPNIEQQADIQKHVQRHLSQESSGKWLLVFDSADDIDMWMDKVDDAAGSARRIDYLPKSKHGSILFTTRSRKAAIKLAGKNVIFIGEMDDSVAKHLLKTSLINQDLLTDDQATTGLLQKLTYLPLAVVQAAAYINENQITLSEYDTLLEDTEQNVVDILSEDFEDEGRYRDIRNPIATTWLISFEQIRHRNLLAAEYLSFMSCIDAKNIPLSLLPPAQSTKKAVDAIGTLSAYSFVTKHETSQFLNLHQLVHLVTRNWLRMESSLEQWTANALKRLDEVFLDSDHENRSVWRAYLPHARYALQSELDIDEVPEKAGLLWKFGMCVYRDGRYSEAEKAFTQLTEASRKVLGADHPLTLIGMANLATAFSSQARWKEAEVLEIQVIEIRKRMLSMEHPDILAGMANLAVTYHQQGRWAEAEDLQVQVMKTRKRILDAEHPDMLISISNLASTYQNQGRWTEAEELEMKVVEIRKRMLGAEHPDTLLSMSNLASTYQNQGRWTEAEELEMKVVETRKRMLGAEHPDTLLSMGNLAFMYNSQGRWTEAEELGLQAIEIGKRILDKEHPIMLAIVTYLASAFSGQGRWKEAEELELQVIEIGKRVLGMEHPIMLASMTGLASTFLSQGRWKEAEELVVQVVETDKRVLGAEHPDALVSMNNLACTWKGQGRDKEAIALMKECVRLREHVLGPSHPFTSVSRVTLTQWEEENLR